MRCNRTCGIEGSTVPSLFQQVADPDGLFDLQHKRHPHTRFVQVYGMADGFQHIFRLGSVDDGEDYLFFRLYRYPEQFHVFMDAGSATVDDGSSFCTGLFSGIHHLFGKTFVDDGYNQIKGY